MKIVVELSDEKWQSVLDGTWCGSEEIAKGIPLPKGHWITKIKSEEREDMWPTNPKCSLCGGEPYYSNTIYNYKFCPFCGADMREGKG